MKLWRSWDIGQKLIGISITFILVLLFGSFLNEEGELLYELYQMTGYMSGFGLYLDQSEKISMYLIQFTMKLNQFRIIFLLPLSYSLIVLLKNNHNRKISCVSAIIESVLVISFMFTGRGILSFKIFFLLIASLLHLLGSLVTKTNKSFIHSEKSCNECGKKNSVSAKYCLKCGENI